MECGASFILLALTASLLTGFNMVGAQQNTTDGATTDSKAETRAVDKGLEPVYIMTKTFLDLVRPADDKNLNDTIEIVQSISKGNFDFILKDYATFLQSYIGFSACIGIGLLFVVFMPLIGCIFCCCRCCCKKCGGQEQFMEGKHAKCQRVCCGILLAIFTTLMLGGMVCAFLTNEQIYAQTKSPRSVEEQRYAALDIINKQFKSLDAYVANTIQDVEKATLKPFNDTVNGVISDLNNAGKKAQDYVGTLTNATTLLNNAQSLAGRVEQLAIDLEKMNTTIRVLEGSSKALETSLEGVKTNITTTLQAAAECANPLFQDSCDTMKEEVKNLKIAADFQLGSVLDAVNDALTKIKDVQEKNITGLVNKAQVEYDRIVDEVNDNVKNGITEAEKETSKIYVQVEGLIADLKKQIEGFNFENMADEANKTVGPYAATYGNYRWYAGIGLSSVLLLVVLFYYLGLAFGGCGERPGIGARTCNKGVGANMLMAGVGFSFLFSWLLMLVIVVLFTAGGLLYTDVCRPLVDPLQRAEVAVLFDSFLPNTGGIKISTALSECKNDVSAYKAFGLNSIIDLDDVLDVDKYNLTGAINSSAITIPTINIMDGDLKEQLGELGNSSLGDINVTAITAEINQGITAIDLTIFAGKLENFTAITDVNLNSSATDLRDIQTNQVANMKTKVDDVETATKNVEKSMNIKDETNELINGIETAEKRVNNNATTYVQEIVLNTTKEVVSDVKAFASKLKGQIENDIGKCGRVDTAVNEVINGVCVNLMYPFNGFWYCFGWCIFFFIPSIFLAVNLVGLYRRTEKYDPSRSGGLNYDDYEGIHPGDTIPLEALDQHKSNGGGRGGVHNGGYEGRGDYPRSKPNDYDDNRRGNHANGYDHGNRGGYDGYRGPNNYAPQDRSLDHGHGYPGGPPSYRAPEPPQYHSNSNRYGGQRW